jgi:hypothetical protein
VGVGGSATANLRLSQRCYRGIRQMRRGDHGGRRWRGSLGGPRRGRCAGGGVEVLAAGERGGGAGRGTPIGATRARLVAAHRAARQAASWARGTLPQAGTAPAEAVAGTAAGCRQDRPLVPAAAKAPEAQAPAACTSPTSPTSSEDTAPDSHCRAAAPWRRGGSSAGAARDDTPHTKGDKGAEKRGGGEAGYARSTHTHHSGAPLPQAQARTGGHGPTGPHTRARTRTANGAKPRVSARERWSHLPALGGQLPQTHVPNELHQRPQGVQGDKNQEHGEEALDALPEGGCGLLHDDAQGRTRGGGGGFTRVAGCARTQDNTPRNQVMPATGGAIFPARAHSAGCWCACT